MSSIPVPPSPQASADGRARARTARLKLFAILAVCAAPVIASYVTYYVVKPEGRTNYGELVDPQVPVGTLGGLQPDGAPLRLAELRGRWVLLSVEPGACETACQQRLWIMRQVRLTTGRDRDRVERLLLTGDAVPTPAVLAEHEGLRVARADAAALAGALVPAPGATMSAHIWVVDPLGNLMMRFPADVDPNRMKKDLAKLLKISRVG